MISGSVILRNCDRNLSGNANTTARIVNEIFAALPNRFRFTSGCRTKAENSRVNGAANSYHLKALAADFVPVDGRFTDTDKRIINQILSKYNYELITHNAGSGMHYHIEPAKGSNIFGFESKLPLKTENILSNEIGTETKIIFGAIGVLALLIILR